MHEAEFHFRAQSCDKRKNPMLLDEIRGSVSLEEFGTKRGVGTESLRMDKNSTIIVAGDCESDYDHNS